MNTTGKLERIERDHSAWFQLVELDQTYFPRPWKADDWNSLDLSQHSLWSWQKHDTPIGFALFATPEDETAHLLKILIRPDHRGSGEAMFFWTDLCYELKQRGYLKVYLEVEESNVRARAYYQKLGFLVLRRVKAYYSDGENAVMMQLAL